MGDAEQWSALLPPEKYLELKQRVDLDFAFTNSRYFAADDPIRMDLYVKNVSTLIVKVYEINTFNFYQQNQREVNTDINLDGLVANAEQTFQYEEPAVRRVSRHFEFPELAKPGVYVIDFIGNGKNSRAVVRKGQLRHLLRTSTVGHIFTVLDERNEVLKDASLWLAGHEYRAADRRHDRGALQHAARPAAHHSEPPGTCPRSPGSSIRRKTISWRPGCTSIARPCCRARRPPCWCARRCASTGRPSPCPSWKTSA